MELGKDVFFNRCNYKFGECQAYADTVSIQIVELLPDTSSGGNLRPHHT